MSQRFYVGQSYRIQRPERSRYQMFVWPFAEIPSPIIYEGDPSSFQLKSDALVKQIDFQVTGLPSDWAEDGYCLNLALQRQCA